MALYLNFGVRNRIANLLIERASFVLQSDETFAAERPQLHRANYAAARYSWLVLIK